MRHPSEGVLRRLVDEPAGVTDDDRAHVAGCPTCLRALETARAEARLVDAALATSATVDTDAAWARFAATSARPPPSRGAPGGRARGRWRPGAAPSRGRRAQRRRALTGAGVAAANDWLPIFRTEQVDPIEVTSGDLVALPDLSAYGDVEILEEPHPEQVADAAPRHGANRSRRPRGGRAPRRSDRGPDLPGGRRRERHVHVLRRQGRPGGGRRRPGPAAPARRAGRQFAAAAGRSGRRGRSGRSPRACRPWSSPAWSRRRSTPPASPFETVRDYLLSLPGVPAGSPTSSATCPRRRHAAPARPAELVTTSTADVNGARRPCSPPATGSSPAWSGSRTA